MRFQLTCNKCGATWSARGEIEDDVNATVIRDDDAGCPECGSDDFTIGEGDYDDDEPEAFDPKDNRYKWPEDRT